MCGYFLLLSTFYDYNINPRPCVPPDPAAAGAVCPQRGVRVLLGGLPRSCGAELPPPRVRQHPHLPQDPGQRQAGGRHQQDGLHTRLQQTLLPGNTAEWILAEKYFEFRHQQYILFIRRRSPATPWSGTRRTLTRYSRSSRSSGTSRGTRARSTASSTSSATRTGSSQAASGASSSAQSATCARCRWAMFQIFCMKYFRV